MFIKLDITESFRTFQMEVFISSQAGAVKMFIELKGMARFNWEIKPARRRREVKYQLIDLTLITFLPHITHRIPRY